MKEKDLKEFTAEEIEVLREQYPNSTKIKLLKPMVDEEYSVEVGTIGYVDYVDDIGTIHIDWDSGSTLGLIPGVDSFEVLEYPEKIKVIKVEVGKEPAIKEIYNTLKSLQKEVGGYIDCVSTNFSKEGSYDFVVNDEGKMGGFKANRSIYDGKDVIAGNFLIVKANQEDGTFVTLTNDECDFLINKVNELCPVVDPNLDLKEYLHYDIFMEDIDR